MKKNIAVLPGDGVGPEVVGEGILVLGKIAKKFHHQFIFKEGLVGACAIEKVGDPFPKETQELCENSDAILFGAIGHPRFDNDPTAKVRPEQGLLKMRKVLGLYANVRPIISYGATFHKSPIKSEIIKGVDFVFIRELTGGIYFGKKGRSQDRKTAFDTCNYSAQEILRVGKFAFDLAMTRKQKLTLVDKANVLETSRLWRETIQKLAKKYPKVAVNYMFVDNAAMQILKKPTDFDVILTENMFGDILTDESSVIAGSLGMLPSASVGEKTALFEPIHGSYPKAAGKNVANPVGTILSVAMMLDYLNLKKESQAVNKAVKKALQAGYGTKDIILNNPLSTTEFGKKICQFI